MRGNQGTEHFMICLTGGFGLDTSCENERYIKIMMTAGGC